MPASCTSCPLRPVFAAPPTLPETPSAHASRARCGTTADKIDRLLVGAVGAGGWEGCRGKGCGGLAPRTCSPRTCCGPRGPTGANGRRWRFCCGAGYCCRGCSHEPCGPERYCCVNRSSVAVVGQMISYRRRVDRVTTVSFEQLGIDRRVVRRASSATSTSTWRRRDCTVGSDPSSPE